MIVLDWQEFTSSGRTLGPLAMTIGVFDGVHRGHQALLSSIQNHPGTTSCVCTFSGNPLLLLAPDRHPGDIMSVSQKICRFRELGTAILILIDFSHDFSKLSGREFLSVVMTGSDLRYLALGRNFRFGYRNDTSAYDAERILSARKIPVEIIPPVTYRDEPISSSRIRKAIMEGRLDEAGEMLGNPFSLDVSHLDGNNDDHTVHVRKTATRQVLPPAGSYECSILFEDGNEKTIVSIGQEVIEWKQEHKEQAKYITFAR